MMFPSKSSGFTLIELLIVLVLVGLTSSIVLPNMWQQLDQVKRYSEKQQLVSLLNYAKQYVIYTGKELELTLDGSKLEVRQQSDTKKDEQSKRPIIKSLNFSQLSFEAETILLSSEEYFLKKQISFIYKDTKQSETVEL